MIWIGLAGWGDHMSLYTNGIPGGDKLRAYSAHFPLVEVDSSFYAIQPQRNYKKWADSTPDAFGFIIKAHQAMTGHTRGAAGPTPAEPGDEASLYEAFRDSIAPVLEAGKCRAVLFQYPPWFDCTRENVDILRRAKARMKGIPVVLEFRHQSWYTPEMRDKTLQFLKQEGWFHSVCDEPQAGQGSIPIVPMATNKRLTLVRFHGRNVQGWNKTGNGEEWREVRYLYQYKEPELQEWAERIKALASQSEEVCVIFNNNSGGHAAGNAKQLTQLLGLSYEGLAPRQLDLFDGL